ncbi:MAG: DUF262 domain-containing protein [Bacilli bacterium]
MQITPSDPDIATIYGRIKKNKLDLQPNFQRGEVWGLQKKQRLIDSILRGWHVPPIHIVQPKEGVIQEVLDGQQRLAAIRDFMEDKFPINGEQTPVNEFIKNLDGIYWKDLDEDIKDEFEGFTIRVLTLTNYEVEEPGELFYRLNQPTNLTSAEQRNAFFGDTRQQIKELSTYMVDSLGFNTSSLGFSNSRMAYDDIIAKLLITLECETLKKKITANIVTARFRDGTPFSEMLITNVRDILKILSSLIIGSNISIKLNKATALTWMVFIYKFRKLNLDNSVLLEFFNKFEHGKENYRNQEPYISLIYSVFHDRSSARVADTSSVILRDLSMWSLYLIYFHVNENLYFDILIKYIDKIKLDIKENHESVNEKDFENIANKLNWGADL